MPSTTISARAGSRAAITGRPAAIASRAAQTPPPVRLGTQATSEARNHGAGSGSRPVKNAPPHLGRSRELFQARTVGAVADEHEAQILVKIVQNVQSPDGVAEALVRPQRPDAENQPARRRFHGGGRRAGRPHAGGDDGHTLGPDAETAAAVGLRLAEGDDGVGPAQQPTVGPGRPAAGRRGGADEQPADAADAAERGAARRAVRPHR